MIYELSYVKTTPSTYYLEWENNTGEFEDVKILGMWIENYIDVLSLVKAFEKAGIRYKLAIANSKFLESKDLLNLKEDPKFNTLE